MSRLHMDSRAKVKESARGCFIRSRTERKRWNEGRPTTTKGESEGKRQPRQLAIRSQKYSCAIQGIERGSRVQGSKRVGGELRSEKELSLKR